MAKNLEYLEFSLVAIGTVATALASFYAYQSVVASNQSVSVSRCQQRNTELAPTIDFLNDFLLDPHVEDMGWPLHNGLARGLMTGAAVRRNLGRPVWAEPHACALMDSFKSSQKPQTATSDFGYIPATALTISGGASTASIPVNHTEIKGSDGTLKTVSGDLIGGQQSVSGDFVYGQQSVSGDPIVGGNQYDDIDCLLDRANRMAYWLDSSPTGGFVKASDLAGGKKKLIRNSTSGFKPFNCRNDVSRNACKVYQAKLNEIVFAAYRVRDLLAEKASKCK